jgi:hypothetical protein
MQKTNKLHKEFSMVFFFFFITFNLALFILSIGFFNEALFILHGIDLNLLENYSVESFIAFRNIRSSKLIILLMQMILSIVSFYWTLRLRQRLNKWFYSILFLVYLIISILSIVFVFFYFMMPGNMLQ